MVVLVGRRGSWDLSTGTWMQRNALFVMALLLACQASSSWCYHHHHHQGFFMRPLRTTKTTTKTTTRPTPRIIDPWGSSRLCAASDENASNDEEETNDEDEDDEDEEEMIQPYGRRSLAWTKRYRRLIPYSVARANAVAMGMTTPEDYQRWRRGPYQIQRPEEMYAVEWISWDEFLGTMRTYDDTRQLVRLLQLQSMEEYQDFVRQDPKRAEGLRIPARPDIVYKDCGWENAHLFFFGGTSDIDITNQED